MTGDLVDAPAPNSRDLSHLQKPFRISEVLAMFREIFARTHAGKI
jgi:hypothetical protein